MTTLLPARLTFEEFLVRPETEHREEIVDGLVLEMNSPTGPHQRLVRGIWLCLERDGPPGHVVLPGLDWVLSSDPLVVRVPDLLVLPEHLTRESQLLVPPLLAVEVLSPDSVERDLVTKRREYAAAGLRHYLVADPEAPALQYFAGERLAEAGRAVGGAVLPLTGEYGGVSLVPAELS